MKNFSVLLLVFMNFGLFAQSDFRWMVANGLGKSGILNNANNFQISIPNNCGNNLISLNGLQFVPNFPGANYTPSKDVFAILDNGTYINTRFSNSIPSTHIQNESLVLNIPNCSSLKYLYLTSRYEQDDPPEAISVSPASQNIQSISLNPVSTPTFSSIHDIVPKKDYVIIIPQSVSCQGNLKLVYDSNIFKFGSAFESNNNSQSWSFFNHNSDATSTVGEISSIQMPSNGNQNHFFAFRPKLDSFPANLINQAVSTNLYCDNNLIATVTDTMRAVHDPNMAKIKCIFKKGNKYFILYRMQFMNYGSLPVDSVILSMKLPKYIKANTVKVWNWGFGFKYDCIDNREYLEKYFHNGTLYFKFKKPFLGVYYDASPIDQRPLKGGLEFCAEIKKCVNPKKLKNKLMPSDIYTNFDGYITKVDTLYDPKVLSKKWELERPIYDDCNCGCIKPHLFKNKQLK
jgi:hypothetical protein